MEDAAGVPIQGLRDGNRLPTVPEFQAAFSLNYVGDQWGEWTPFGNLTWQYVGDRFTQVSEVMPRVTLRASRQRAARHVVRYRVESRGRIVASTSGGSVLAISSGPADRS